MDPGAQSSHASGTHLRLSSLCDAWGRRFLSCVFAQTLRSRATSYYCSQRSRCRSPELKLVTNAPLNVERLSTCRKHCCRFKPSVTNGVVTFADIATTA